MYVLRIQFGMASSMERTALNLMARIGKGQYGEHEHVVEMILWKQFSNDLI